MVVFSQIQLSCQWFSVSAFVCKNSWALPYFSAVSGSRAVPNIHFIFASGRTVCQITIRYSVVVGPNTNSGHLWTVSAYGSSINYRSFCLKFFLQLMNNYQNKEKKNDFWTSWNQFLYWTGILAYICTLFVLFSWIVGPIIDIRSNGDNQLFGTALVSSQNHFFLCCWVLGWVQLKCFLLVALCIGFQTINSIACKWI